MTYEIAFLKRFSWLMRLTCPHDCYPSRCRCGRWILALAGDPSPGAAGAND